MALLGDYIKLKRRYMRSVNLERDLEIVDSVNGYIITPKALDTLERLLNSYFASDTIRSRTLTGVYGTGKSAFAHFFTSLCAPNTDPMKNNALEILNQFVNTKKYYELIKKDFPERGLIRAVSTATYEPVSNTIIKALHRGVTLFWKDSRKKPDVIGKLDKLLSNGGVKNEVVLELIQEVGRASKTGVLLLIDELGKNLEFAAYNQSVGDLYLLQQIAELPADEKNPTVLIIGLLHRAFADYAHNLTVLQRNEWGKIQGRFEDIPFTESSEELIRLIGHAIDKIDSKDIKIPLEKWAMSWNKSLDKKVKIKGLSVNALKSVYPLHPLSALVLPVLCSRYAQNDRTIFSFLTGDEPHSLTHFLKEKELEEDLLPSLKLHRLYDYFVESAGITMSSRPQYQRWVEIQGILQDVKSLEPDERLLLKTIGILNLISLSGTLKASRKLLPLAMCDTPEDTKVIKYWDSIIEKLLNQGILTWRKQIDEIRLWEGSDFDIEQALTDQIEAIKIPLSQLLLKFNPLNPIIPQRHSYKTGTLRYFERHYIDSSCDINNVECINKDNDGVICYWLDNDGLKLVPEYTKSGKPLIFIYPYDLKALNSACLEYAALRMLEKNTPKLLSDGVARREVRYRLIIAKKLMDDAFEKTFRISKANVQCWVCGEKKEFSTETEFRSVLSDICDKVYNSGLSLWNELINRRDLTSQASSARKLLIEAMINNTEKDKFGIDGYGPERSMYESIFNKTGIHIKKGELWEITEPEEDSGMLSVWNKIKEFCLEVTEEPKTLDGLYEILTLPPYGVKGGSIPVLLAAILIKYSDEISIYKEGTFIPTLGSEHFELMMKKPQKFAVKYIPISGLRWKIFKELEVALSGGRTRSSYNIRNETLLGVVKPLVKFANALPDYTKNTKTLSEEGKLVRDALLNAKEPDQLLFRELPGVLGLEPIEPDEEIDDNKVNEFKNRLFKALKEISSSYEILLGTCKELLFEAFNFESGKDDLRKILQKRVAYIQDKCVEKSLKSFVFATIDDSSSDKEWIEAISMITGGKPPLFWNDDDIIVFENKLGDTARKFKNLEALQKDMPLLNGDYEVKRITLTRSDGSELHKMLWINQDSQNRLDDITREILNKLDGNQELQQALVASLAEKFLKPE